MHTLILRSRLLRRLTALHRRRRPRRRARRLRGRRERRGHHLRQRGRRHRHRGRALQRRRAASRPQGVRGQSRQRRATQVRRQERQAGHRHRRAARRVPAAGVRRPGPEDPHRCRTRPRPTGRRGPRTEGGGEELDLGDLFVGIDSGKIDVAFSNVTDTEERKKKYEFASYRQDNLAFEVPKQSTWNFAGDYENYWCRSLPWAPEPTRRRSSWSGRRSSRRRARSSPSHLLRTTTASYLALSVGRSTPTSGPTPVSRTTSPRRRRHQPEPATRQVSGAGATLQGLIAATAKKDSGLAKPVADAINHLVKDGRCRMTHRLNLSNSRQHRADQPAGLPLDNS